jgi:ankyrin repeat protein
MSALHFSSGSTTSLTAVRGSSNSETLSEKDTFNQHSFGDSMRAQRRRDCPIIQLLKDSPSVNFCDREGKSLLMTAAELQNARAVKALLKLRADPLQLDQRGWTALHYAVHSKFPAYDNITDNIDRGMRDITARQCAKHLIKKAPNLLNIQTSDKPLNTALTLAISSGYQKTTLFLLINNADPTLQDKKRKNSFHYALTTPLISSATLALFLRKKPELVNVLAGKRQLSPLHIAISARRENPILQLLIGMGANLQAEDHKGKNTFHYFLDYGYLKDRELARFILFKDSALINRTTNNKYAFSPIHLVAQNFQYDKYDLEFLLKQGGDFSSCDRQGWNLLHWMMNDWKLFLEEPLRLRSLENVDRDDKEEQLNKFLDKLDLILSKKPELLNEKDHSGKTPVEYGPDQADSFLSEGEYTQNGLKRKRSDSLE